MALIPEPAGPGGVCVTARKGVGRFSLRIEGVGAHAGAAYGDGARVREAGFANVTALAGGNATHLPFPDVSLDVVVLNGVLEWVPVSFPDIVDPREAQLRLLPGNRARVEA